MVSLCPKVGFAGGFRPALRRRAAPWKLIPGRPTRAWEVKTVKKMTRRGLLGSASAAWATALIGRPAHAAAEFDFKLGVNTPDSHPLTVRLTEAAKEAGARSSGRLNVTVFSNSQLGGDP